MLFRPINEEIEMHKVCVDKIEEINLMADGMLSTEKTSELKSHLAICDACRAFYEDIILLKKSMAALTVEVPNGLEEKISEALRNQKKKKPITQYIYRYVGVAAAFLVIVAAFLAFRTFIPSSKTYDSAEMGNINSEAAADGAGARFSDTYDDAAKTTENRDTESISSNQPESSIESEPFLAPEVDENADSGLDEYKYTSSALKTNSSMIVNSDGIPLDSGYGDMQDIFYASRAYTLCEILAVLTKEFDVGETFADNDYIFFYTSIDLLTILESRFDLVAADKLKEKKDVVSVRIISLK